MSARQAEDALCDDVPLDLGGPAHDGLGAGVEELPAPDRVVERGGAEHLEPDLLEPLVDLAAEDLLDRALDARVPGALELRQAPVAGQAEELDVDPRAREPIAQHRVGERAPPRDGVARFAQEPLETPPD